MRQTNGDHCSPVSSTAERDGLQKTDAEDLTLFAQTAIGKLGDNLSSLAATAVGGSRQLLSMARSNRARCSTSSWKTAVSHVRA
jgi:hypothetical protein